MGLTTVLLDLDGVVRHFNPRHVAHVESEHGLAAGSLAAAAFEPVLLESVITGRRSRREWTAAVGEVVGSMRAAQLWMAERGEVDDEMMRIVDGLRSTGITVAVLTNGTDTIPVEMVALGLADRFDGIFNSADIGFAKPDRRAFEYVCRELGVDPAAIFFTDDSSTKLAGARAIGMEARTFVGTDTFHVHLTELGLRP